MLFDQRPQLLSQLIRLAFQQLAVLRRWPGHLHHPASLALVLQGFRLANHILKHHHVKALLRCRSAQRHHLKAYLPRPCFRLNLHSFLPHGCIAFFCHVQGRTQVDQQTFTRHFCQAEAGLAGGRFQVGSGLAVELHNLHLIVHHNAGWNKPVHQQMLHFPFYGKRSGQLAGELRVSRSDRQVIRVREVGSQPCRGLPLLVDLVFLVDQSEVVGKSSQVFRRSQHQVASGFQRVVQRGDNPPLQNWPQIDQQVAAAHQIQV